MPGARTLPPESALGDCRASVRAHGATCQVTREKEHGMLDNSEAKSHHVVIYARTAADGRRALETQITQLRAVAARYGWTDPHVLTEIGERGITDEALRTVLSCDVVLVRDITRLARDVDRLIEIRRSLIGRGVVLAMPDRLESPDMAQQHLDVMMLLRPGSAAGPRRGDHAESSRQDITSARAGGRRRIVQPRRSTPQEEPSAAVHGQVAWLTEELRRLDRAAHAERTRWGIAAAKARREAQQ
ncbi:recombinase family protein [Blastococcus montanus]|uniref:recombinase family protein n=1 Tax=Blastococcus montanus TaxID=3144973 RepID=UPI00320B4E33